MSFLQSLFIILILTAIVSFNTSSKSKPEPAITEHQVIDTLNTKLPMYRNTAEVVNYEIKADTFTTINFKELSVTINRLIVYDPDHNLNQIQKDSVSIYSELTETIEGQNISIVSENLINIRVEQRYETSVTIMFEGPHCDLLDWKHYYSEWKQLQPNIFGQYTGEIYLESEKNIFPEMEIDELKQAVKKVCGDEAFKMVEKITTPNEYPSGVGISRYFLRITGQMKNNGETISRLIVIENPMGC